MAGKGVSGEIVCTPVPGMAKSMTCVPGAPAFESRIAWRSDPGPLSAAVLTSNVDSSVRHSTGSTRG
jgi:hypothetical protein